MKSITAILKGKIIPVGLTVFFIVLAFSYISDTKVFRPDDESLYVQIAKEMYERKDPWVPTWFGEYAFYKPPLSYWISMLGFLINGISIISARISVAIISLATIFITFLLGYELYGRKEGILAAIITATSLGFIIYGRIAMMDLPLCFSVTLAIYFFHRASRSARWIVGFFVTAGLSTLIKGPVSFIILMLFSVSFCLMARKCEILINRLTWVGILLSLAEIIIWPLAVHLKGCFNEWYSFFIIRENIGKFHEGINYPGYVIIGYLMQYLLPWSPLFLVSIWIVFAKRLYRNDKTLFPLLWIIVIILIHLLPETKLKHYSIPAIPPAAILIASFAESKAMKVGKILLQIVLIVMLLFLLSLFRIINGWVNFFLLGITILLLIFSIATSNRNIRYCGLLYGFALICMFPVISSLTYYRLPAAGLPYLKDEKVAVVCLQSYVYSFDVGKFIPQITNAVDFNLFLLDGGRIIISESDLQKFSTITGFILVPVDRVYSWRQWKKILTPDKLFSALWKGDTADLIEDIYILKKLSDMRKPIHPQE